MPKLKNNKGILKRVKLSKKGKVSVRRGNQVHFRSIKTGRAKQKFSSNLKVSKAIEEKVNKAIKVK